MNTCICEMAPGHSYPNREQYLLDHRCPTHGEKAMPYVWGRHTDLKLFIDVKTFEALLNSSQRGARAYTRDYMLHVLRNPHGWSEEQIRQARNDAADEVEQLRKTKVRGVDEGYKDAFFDIASLLGFDTAMPISPKEAFDTLIRPRIGKLIVAEITSAKASHGN